MLRIENLTKTYGEKRAVDNLSLKIAPGEICAFIGHNGAGKTTTIKSVCGVIQFDAGEIYIDDISIKEDPIACKMRTAYLPDNPDLYEFLPGIKYLSFIADVYGIPADVRQERIRKYSDLEELTREILIQLIDSIEIFEPEKIGKQRVCRIRVSYRFVGAVSDAMTGAAETEEGGNELEQAV